jgi:hypothetical protein
MKVDMTKLEKRLLQCGYGGELFSERKTLINRVIELTKNKTVGFGSSLTIEQLDLKSAIKNSVTEMYHHVPGGHGESERKALLAQVFITSANGLAQTGEIVNIDGTGNRVGATCFGPETLIYIVGQNKITPDLPSAMIRAKETAIKIATKYKKETPCAKTGVCGNCLSPQSVCSLTTIHRKKPNGINVHVFIIKEDLGL